MRKSAQLTCSVLLVVEAAKQLPGPSLAGSRLTKNLLVDRDFKHPIRIKCNLLFFSLLIIRFTFNTSTKSLSCYIFTAVFVCVCQMYRVGRGVYYLVAYNTGWLLTTLAWTLLILLELWHLWRLTLLCLVLSISHRGCWGLLGYRTGIVKGLWFLTNDSALEQWNQIHLGSNSAMITIKTILGDYCKKKEQDNTCNISTTIRFVFFVCQGYRSRLHPPHFLVLYALSDKQT